MTTFLSKELHADLTRAQKDKKVKKSRLRVEFDGALVPVLKLWDNGFSMDIEHAPQLRGLVDIFDGSRHLSQCLIICLLYTSPSPRDQRGSRMPSSA